MKNIFLKNGISLFGALLLSQASFCSDRPIDPSNNISQAIKRGRSETSLSMLERDQLLIEINTRQEDRLTSERLLKVLPNVLNDFKQQSPSKPFDPELFKILMAAAFKIDPSAPVGKSKTLYAAIVDVACNGGNLDEDKIAILRKHLEENFFTLQRVERLSEVMSFKDFNDYMSTTLNPYKELLISSDYESISRVFSTVFYILCQKIGKDNTEGRIDFNNHPVYKDDEKINEMSQLIWNMYRDAQAKADIASRMYQAVDSVAKNWKLKKHSSGLTEADLDALNLFANVDIRGHSEIESLDDINELRKLVDLVAKIDLKKTWDDRTPCCYILDKFIDGEGEKKSKNDANININIHTRKFISLKKALLFAIKYVLQRDPSQESLIKIIDQLEIDESNLLNRRPKDEALERKIAGVRIVCVAEILCKIFQRYFTKYPEDPDCIGMQRYCWTRLDNNIERDEEGVELRISKNEMGLAEDDGAEVDWNDISEEVDACYYSSPIRLIKEELRLFNDIRDAIRAPLQGQTPLNGNPQ